MPPKKKSNSSKKSSKINEKEDKKLTETFIPVKKSSTRTGKAHNEEINDNYATTQVDIQEILKQFDLDINYGPIIGISRTDRLKRAEYFEIPLIDEVKKILNDQDLLEKHPELDLNIWNDLDDHTYLAINKY